ncbi:ARF GTPase-activating protein GIT2 [Echinococcus granulosus]|uniref:ARF GTPase-activating protein GIT2 n=1 Tax=Echinococcus granulosus TaxID=6210 RepID=W6UI97_ECHGR|nr:ARF GTPase-activating protein GIT2 [Echinococcus granulosus]EUB60821.1 ARF GTPase-activating protein GIT2 [Echinococcus granulosus]
MAAVGGVSGATPSTTTTARPSSLILFFLPPNTAYTSVRNQARQKLGRLSMTAFRALVVDVLHEAAHRLVPLLESSSTVPLAVVRPKMRHHEYTTYGGPVDGTGVAVDNDDEVLVVVSGGSDGGDGVEHRATNKMSSMSVDDPVYDQLYATGVEVISRKTALLDKAKRRNYYLNLVFPAIGYIIPNGFISPWRCRRGDGGGYGATCLSIHGSFNFHDRCLYHHGDGFDIDVDITNYTDFDVGGYLGVLADGPAAAVSGGVARSSAARRLLGQGEHSLLGRELRGLAVVSR